MRLLVEEDEQGGADVAPAHPAPAPAAQAARAAPVAGAAPAAATVAAGAHGVEEKCRGLLGHRLVHVYAWVAPVFELSRCVNDISLSSNVKRATMPRVPRALIALTALAAALRLPTLGSQSLWLDEVLTGNLARGSLGDLFHVVAQQEANPPLFYLLEWVWTRVAGTSEFALRLPSALFGIALVPVGYAIGRRLAGERTAVALAALVAVHPLLVYYSQEARGYSAVALACAVGFLFFLDALGAAGVGARVGGRARLPLLRDLPDRDRGGDPARAPRPRGPAVGGVVVVGPRCCRCCTSSSAATTPTTSRGAGLAARAKGVVTSWIVGERGAAIDNLEWLGGALLLAGAVLAIRRRER